MSIAVPITGASAGPSDSLRAPDVAGSASLLELLLNDQQTTAVGRFAQWHDRDVPPLQARYYHDLIPLSRPAAGEQYAFEVDLDACSGCKACVVACHNLNGLEEAETWRSVGLLHGGASHAPVLQHVTTACHHCVEPACLDGCPVLAYEKDPLTGIVRHLDDQCIGCQYCILKCPYDVPQYSHRLGIVRKCDMCSDRLAASEAPACVQSCPQRAIRITVVSKQSAIEHAEANLFLPGAPEPSYTLPTTVYKTRRPLPANLLPADYFAASPQLAHWPLVLMLVLTQMSVGALVVDQIAESLAPLAGGRDLSGARIIHQVTVFALGLLGLAAAILHLGRPWLAYRAVIGWRTSWLSREVIAFGAFAAAALGYAALPYVALAGIEIAPMWRRALGIVVAASGLAGVACSVMIYASTRRPFWNPAYTAFRFLLTCLVLGIPVAVLIRLANWTLADGGAPARPWQQASYGLCLALLAAAAAKLLAEGAVFTWLRGRTFTPLRRTAVLLAGDLARTTQLRFAAGAVGGLLLPVLLANWLSPGSTLPDSTLPDSTLPHPALVVAVAVLMLILNFVGETAERYLFFAAVVAPKMPGAPSS